VLDARTNSVIQGVLSGECRTLLQYACEAFPRFTPGDQAELARLQSLADQELAAARNLMTWFARHGGHVPPTDPYPSWYTQINFISIPFLLPQLEKDHREAIARLRAALVAVGDPEARQCVQAILEQKIKSLAAFRGQPSASPAAARATNGSQ
jgi:hypothetical protein